MDNNKKQDIKSIIKERIEKLENETNHFKILLKDLEKIELSKETDEMLCRMLKFCCGIKND